VTDYSTAATNIEDALNDAAEAGVEEYEIGTNRRRVKRPNILDLVKARLLLDGINSRQGRGIFSLGKFKNPR
jgi:sugar phosphate isomerase/epimerase